jgi:hypothetical protein
MSRWPRSLRGGSAAARLLGLWVRIAPGHGFLSLENIVFFQVEFPATDQLHNQKSPTECGVSECDLETSIKPTPTRAVEPRKKKQRKMPVKTAMLPLTGPQLFFHTSSPVSFSLISPLVYQCISKRKRC